MNIDSRLRRLEGKVKPAANETLAGVIGGSDAHFCVVDTISRPGYARLPDGRWLTRAEWKSLLARYAGCGGQLVVELDM